METEWFILANKYRTREEIGFFQTWNRLEKTAHLKQNGNETEQKRYLHATGRWMFKNDERWNWLALLALAGKNIDD